MEAGEEGEPGSGHGEGELSVHTQGLRKGGTCEREI